jgi:hypothetical protein
MRDTLFTSKLCGRLAQLAREVFQDFSYTLRLWASRPWHAGLAITALWKPAAFSAGNNGWETVARLKPVTTWPQARAAFAPRGRAPLAETGKRRRHAAPP